MKLKDLMNCSAPLLAEHVDEEAYPYWFGGTCFRVRCEGFLHVATAAHCLKDKPKDKVRVQRHPESRVFLTLTGLATQSEDARHQDDPDHDDWAVLEAVDPGIDESDPLGEVLDLDQMPLAKWDEVEGHTLAIRGYPKAICGIDYERQAIKWRAFAGSGRYVGQPEWSKFCHTMRLDDVSEIENIDGLSGSPIFKLIPVGSAFQATFAGMALRGSKESGLVHFLDAQVVVAAIRMVASKRS